MKATLIDSSEGLVRCGIIICRRTEVRAAPSEYTTEWMRVEEKEKLPIQEGIEAYIFAFQDLLQVRDSFGG